MEFLYYDITLNYLRRVRMGPKLVYQFMRKVLCGLVWRVLGKTQHSEPLSGLNMTEHLERISGAYVAVLHAGAPCAKLSAIGACT